MELKARQQVPNLFMALRWLGAKLCGKPAHNILCMLALLVLAACANAHPSALPGGGTGYAIGCSGIQNTMDDCYAKAAQICPAGYDVAAATQEFVPIINPFERSMYVRCH
jgi:hypothetical protein